LRCEMHGLVREDWTSQHDSSDRLLFALGSFSLGSNIFSLTLIFSLFLRQIDELMAVFNVSLMPEVRKGSMTADEARDNFVHRLEGTKDSIHTHITLGEFVNYYSWLSASIIDDGNFVMVIEDAWGVPELDIDEVRFGICCKGMKENAMKKVSGVADDFKARNELLKTLRHCDLENKGGLFMPQFLKAAQRLCCSMDEEYGAIFMKKYGEEGVLDYKRMADDMYGK